MPTTITDAFPGADGALTVTETGETWVHQVAGFSRVSNRAKSSVANAVALIVAPTADSVVQATFAVFADGAGFIVRRSASNSYWQFAFNSAGVTVASVRSGAGQYEGAFSSPIANGDVLSIECSGNAMNVKVNGSSIGIITDSYNATAGVGFGIRAADTTAAEIDNFSIVSQDPAGTTLYPDDPSIIYDPQTWELVGTGATSKLVCRTTGNPLAVAVDGGTRFKMNYDSGGDTETIYSLDDGIPTNLVASDGLGTLNFGDYGDLDDVPKQLWLYPTKIGVLNQWGAYPDGNYFAILSFEVDAGNDFEAPTQNVSNVLLTKPDLEKVRIIGDSLTAGAGYELLSTSGHEGGIWMWPYAFTNAFEYVPSIHAYGGQGVDASPYATPSVLDAWSDMRDGLSLLDGDGKWTEDFAAVIIAHGTNGATTQAQVLEVVENELSALITPATPIRWILPVGRFNRAAIIAGVEQAATENPSADIGYIDLDPDGDYVDGSNAEPYALFPSASLDWTHHRIQIDTILTGRLIKAWDASVVNAGGGGSGSSTRRGMGMGL